MAAAKQYRSADVRVSPDGQKEENVHGDEDHGEDGATVRFWLGYLGLDHQPQEIGEEYHKTSLGSKRELNKKKGT